MDRQIEQQKNQSGHKVGKVTWNSGGVCRKHGCDAYSVDLGFCQDCLKKHKHRIAVREQLIKEIAVGDIDLDRVLDQFHPWLVVGC